MGMMRLQHEKCSFSSYKETVQKVFQMFPPGPKLTEPSPDRCRRCAVVGNSVNLRGSHYGPLIDFHDVIIRMNKAQIKGYERDVGTKTTHHVMYPHSATNLDHSTHLVLFAFKTSDLDWLTKSLTPHGNKKDKNPGLQANKDLVMILNPAFIQYVHHVWLKKKGMYPSTGFLTLILSLHMCDEVNVFGFGADRSGNWNHYFEKLKRKRLKTGHHPGKDEFKDGQNDCWRQRGVSAYPSLGHSVAAGDQCPSSSEEEEQAGSQAAGWRKPSNSSRVTLSPKRSQQALQRQRGMCSLMLEPCPFTQKHGPPSLKG
ncbi:CMP-N-acetylneuraminate-beta-galactosamide-alpha-2,3-sialyltransferase 1-like [Halichoeres trimaculatus]|uniref:CMP-N-acetylneuraminate-beta-galactosamide- alpha-2,3-sialyltransferase 1-like n=1 Tax=Halichoeres trimaculatus TaxID=147232 RepID=UPI003D9E3BAD